MRADFQPKVSNAKGPEPLGGSLIATISASPAVVSVAKSDSPTGVSLAKVDSIYEEIYERNSLLFDEFGRLMTQDNSFATAFIALKGVQICVIIAQSHLREDAT